MSIYLSFYYTLCSRGKQLKESWNPGSNIHQHHILPRHSGGLDTDDNYTYLSVREHIIAHFLLWKIHHNPDDLRSMKMLGARLTSAQRKITGIWCRDNKIGFHGATKEQRTFWATTGFEKQKDIPGSWGWWASESGRKKRASLGGTKSSTTNPKWLYWQSPEGRNKRAVMGGKAIKGMICVTNGIHRTRITPDKLAEYLASGYIRGFTLTKSNLNFS